MEAIPAVLNLMEARKQECWDKYSRTSAEKLEAKMQELMELNPSLSRIQVVKLYFNLK